MRTQKTFRKKRAAAKLSAVKSAGVHPWVSSRNSPYMIIIALFLGMVLAVGGSVFATTIGNSVTVSAGLTVNGNSTLGDASTDVNLFTGTLQASTTALFTGAVTTYGNNTLGDTSDDTLTVNATTTVAGGITFNAGVLFGDAAGDVVSFNAATLVFNNAGTSTIPSANAAAWAYATSSANVPFLRLDTSNYRIGISTTTPGATFAVGGAGNIYALGGIGVGIATTTAGAFETTGAGLIAGAFNVGGVTQLNGNVVIGNAAADTFTITSNSVTYSNTGTSTIPTNAEAWNYATSSANIPLLKLNSSNTRVGVGTTTPGATFAVGGDGTALIMGGATSTLSIQSTGNSTASRGGCIEVESTAGDGTRFSLMATGAGIAYWTTGGCR